MNAKIDQLVPGGQGIATLDDGKKAFLWNALPSEVVDFEITKNKRTYCEGVATKIVKASPHRVEPKDACYLATSPWQILDYSEELKQKQLLVEECFHQQHIHTAVLPTATDGKDFFYRNKMEYSLYWSNEDNLIHLAFHTRGTHRKAPISQSSIERPEIFAEAQKIIAKLNSEHAEARTYQSLLIRCDQHGKVSSALFENGKAHPVMQSLSDTLNGYKYSYSPNGFFQINLPVYELVLEEISQHIHTDKVLDLYAGVGSIGLSVARDRTLTLVEVNGAAFAEMQNNAANTNAQCILAKSEDVTEYITPDCTVILDPPRAGCDPKLIAKINTVRPESIVYLSCNPITQARDIAQLSNYQIKKLQPYNFFPRTPHIEALAILSKNLWQFNHTFNEGRQKLTYIMLCYNKPMIITILGAGAFGSALGKILTDNHHDIKYYDPYLYPEVNLEQATYQADAIMIAVPSANLQEFLKDYPARLKKLPTILATKGICDPNTFNDFSQFSAISGPGFAQEIIDGKPATFTASAPFAMGLLKNDQISIELQEDLLGILLCGSLKNIYAIGAGYRADSANDTAIYIQHAHAEMQKYLRDHNAKPETAELACGIGDLILTCMNNSSRNYTCGIRLREGKKLPEIIDELKTIEGIYALQQIDRKGYMLLEEIYGLVGQVD